MKADTLKKSILQWAIEGKLVPQLESEPGVEQIGEVPEDVPFAIPEKWKWVLFSDAVKVISSRPFQIKAKEVLEQGLYPVISQSKEQIDGYSNDDKKLIPDSELPIIIFGDHTRTLKYVDFRFVVGADGTKLLHVKTSSIDPKYFYIALQSMIGQTRQRGYSRHFQFLKVLHIPIPPIEEQRRIVAKLNELLPLVESYGKEQEALENVEKEFPDKLRASLLQEAIQGKLVPQLENEPEVAPIGEAPENVPFAIPEKWKWVSASYVQALVRGITFPASAKTKIQTHNSICCLTTGSVQEKYASKADVFVDQSFMKNTRQILQMGDVVISSANSKELVGKSILWEDDSGIQKTFGGFLTVARVKDSQTMIPEYLFLVYRYMFKTGYFANLSTQTTNIANLSNKLLDSLVFPIPPLEEQRRIAAKLNELLGAVVQLENTISAT